MSNTSTYLHAIVTTILLSALASCSSEVGPDTISGHIPETRDGDVADCATCHGPDTALDPLSTSGAGALGKHMVHVAERPYSCGVCHFEYPGAASHGDGRLDSGSSVVQLVRFDSTNPDGDWTFDEATGAGTCSTTACHGPDTVDWYGTNGWTLPDCATCHVAALASRRQVLGAGGDFSRNSHHVIDYADRNSQVVVANDCLVCHNTDYHMAGIVALNEADTGQTIVYVPGSPVTLEPFCLSCHDSDGAAASADSMSPFSSANMLGNAPNGAGTRIRASWNKTSGHNSNGLTCLGTGDPTTGCHGDAVQPNAHGSSNYGLLAQNMSFLIDGGAAFNELDYSLCFSCHASYPGVRKEDILGVESGGNYDYELTVDPSLGPGGSLMVFGYPPYYNDGLQTKFVDSDAHIHRLNNPRYQYQLHWFHLSMRVGNGYDVWLYRGLGVPVGSCTGCHSTDSTIGFKATCTACHDVHGSNTPYAMVYDELTVTHDAEDTTGYLGVNETILETAPVHCGTSACHSNRSSDRNYVYSPTGE